MFYKLSFFLLLALAIANASASTPAREFRGYQWFDQRITFTYDQTLGESVASTLIQQSTDADEITPQGPLPETVEIIFEKHAAEEVDGAYWQPTGAHIKVYHTSTFPAADAPASRTYASLRDLLNLEGSVFDDFVATNGIPTMNQLSASQVLAVRVKQIDFQTGSGVRFITAGAQDVSPLTNAQLFYDFQGLTSDGTYYISARFPISTSILPDESIPMNSQAYDEFMAEYETYIANLTNELNTPSFSDFDPHLSLLDDVILSLSVGSPLETFYPHEATVIEYENLTFQVNPVLANRVEVDPIEGVPVDDYETSLHGASPGALTFSLAGYPLRTGAYAPQVTLFRAADFPAEDVSVFAIELSRLQRLLAERPELTGRAMEWELESLPLLPPLNAAQVIVALPQYVEYDGGTGVRYLAHYSQDASPVTSDRVTYVFAGLSDDGETVIAAQFPLFIAAFPDEYDYWNTNYEDLIANLDQHMAEVLAQLEGMNDSDFVPNLSLLDTLIRSFRID